MDMGWVLLAGGGVLMWFGYTMRRQAKQRLSRLLAHKAQEERDVDLGILGGIAAMMMVGKLTPEQADEEVKLSAVYRPSIQPLWNSMTTEDREELGLNMLVVYADPAFSSKQDQLVGELKAADPALWERAELMVKAREKLHLAEQKHGPLDQLTRDMIQLSVMHPEVYEETKRELLKKATGAAA